MMIVAVFYMMLLKMFIKVEVVLFVMHLLALVTFIK